MYWNSSTKCDQDFFKNHTLKKYNTFSQKYMGLFINEYDSRRKLVDFTYRR